MIKLDFDGPPAQRLERGACPGSGGTAGADLDYEQSAAGSLVAQDLLLEEDGTRGHRWADFVIERGKMLQSSVRVVAGRVRDGPVHSADRTATWCIIEGEPLSTAMPEDKDTRWWRTSSILPFDPGFDPHRDQLYQSDDLPFAVHTMGQTDHRDIARLPAGLKGSRERPSMSRCVGYAAQAVTVDLPFELSAAGWQRG